LAVALTVPTDRRGVPGQLHVGEVESAVSPGQARIAQPIIHDGQRLVGESWVDVVGPQRPALEEMLVGVDDEGHRINLIDRAPGVLCLQSDRAWGCGQPWATVILTEEER
jgi:hypothetical protein